MFSVFFLFSAKPQLFFKSENITEIKLTVDAPFSIATIIIDSQGNIIYEAHPHKPGHKFIVDENRHVVGLEYSETESGEDEIKDSAKIVKTQCDELINLIKTNNFFSFNDKYQEENLEDATTYTITVKKEDIEKSVSCYGECPTEIVEIRNKIKELWGKDIVEIGI